MSDEASPGTRLQRLGMAPQSASLRRKPTELSELTPQHRRFIDYMVHGCPDAVVGQFTRTERRRIDGQAVTVERPLEPREPLRMEEAAAVLRIRLRNARELLGYPLFQAELTKEIQRLRESAKPQAMATLIGLSNDPGQGKAADRKVQLEASQAILGEAAGTRTSVNVTVNNQVVTPGYVIDLSPDPDPLVAKIEGLG